MTKLLHRVAFWLAFASLFAAPWVAVALYNVSPRAVEGGGWAMFNEESGLRVFNLTRGGEIQKLGASDLVVGELDVKEYVIYVADLGLPTSAYFVVPTTGLLIRVDEVHDARTAGSTAVIRLFSSRLAALVGPASTYADAVITAFAMSIVANTQPGTVATDDAINHAVNMGDVIAIETDGGPTNVVQARFSLRFRQR